MVSVSRFLERIRIHEEGNHLSLLLHRKRTLAVTGKAGGITLRLRGRHGEEKHCRRCKGS